MHRSASDLPAFAVDGERARAFVLAHGSPRDRARLEGIFGRPEPDRDVVKELERLQNPDGGFPYLGREGAPSSVESTASLLSQLREIPPLSGSPMAGRALAFLRRTQQTDGSWVEPPAVQDLAPGEGVEQSAREYLTAVAAYALLTMEPVHLDPIARAGNWLRHRLAGPGEGEKAADETLFLAAAIWSKLGGPAADGTDWVHEVLLRRELGGPALTRWLTTMMETGIEARFFTSILELLNHLAATQREDGSFSAAEGCAVEATLNALRVFRGFRLL